MRPIGRVSPGPPSLGSVSGSRRARPRTRPLLPGVWAASAGQQRGPGTPVPPVGAHPPPASPTAVLGDVWGSPPFLMEAEGETHPRGRGLCACSCITVGRGSVAACLWTLTLGLARPGAGPSRSQPQGCSDRTQPGPRATCTRCTPGPACPVGTGVAGPRARPCAPRAGVGRRS